MISLQTLINKKFWSHVKSANNSHRIPECVSYNGVLRNDPKGQAELFNEFFFDQFSEESKYDIDIDMDQGDKFDINITTDSVFEQLMNLNQNKAPGPDDIHPTILKIVPNFWHNLFFCCITNHIGVVLSPKSGNVLTQCLFSKKVRNVKLIIIVLFH